MENSASFYEEAGRRIRDARRNRKPPLTQEELARMVSLTRTSITNIEKGRQKLLLHKFTEIAIALCVEPSSILPQPASQHERQLEEAIKDRSQPEKQWITSAVAAAQKRRGSE